MSNQSLGGGFMGDVSTVVPALYQRCNSARKRREGEGGDGSVSVRVCMGGERVKC